MSVVQNSIKLKLIVQGEELNVLHLNCLTLIIVQSQKNMNL